MERKMACGAIVLSTRYNGGADAFRNQLGVGKKILIGQRGFGGGEKNRWPGLMVACPAGVVDPEEDDATTVVREALEEVNIHFQPDPKPFFEAALDDRDVHYYLGSWHLGEGGIRYDNPSTGARYEMIGSMWLTGEQALQMTLILQYPNLIRKLQAHGLL